jgi:hypothetical protein
MRKGKLFYFFLGLFLVLLSCILYCSKCRSSAGEKNEMINVQLLFLYNQGTVLNNFIHTHTHTHIYIYIYLLIDIWSFSHFLYFVYLYMHH